MLQCGNVTRINSDKLVKYCATVTQEGIPKQTTPSPVRRRNLRFGESSARPRVTVECRTSAIIRASDDNRHSVATAAPWVACLLSPASY